MNEEHKVNLKKEEDKIKSLEILVSATRSKVDYLLNADNALDTKAGVMVALEVTIAIFYIQSINNFCCFSLIPIMVFVFSIYFLWEVLIIKIYNTGVVDFYNDPKNYRLMEPKDLLEQLLSDYQDAFDKNSKHLEDKNKDYKRAVKLFLFGFGFLLLIFFI
jgi:hypothetical protein